MIATSSAFAPHQKARIRRRGPFQDNHRQTCASEQGWWPKPLEVVAWALSDAMMAWGIGNQKLVTLMKTKWNKNVLSNCFFCLCAWHDLEQEINSVCLPFSTFTITVLLHEHVPVLRKTISLPFCGAQNGSSHRCNFAPLILYAAFGFGKHLCFR